jgi:hypothetical protein
LPKWRQGKGGFQISAEREKPTFFFFLSLLVSRELGRAVTSNYSTLSLSIFLLDRADTGNLARPSEQPPLQPG